MSSARKFVAKRKNGKRFRGSTALSVDPNVVGEALRELLFKEPVGCYSCFDVEEGFYPVGINDETYQRLLGYLHRCHGVPDGYVPTCYAGRHFNAMWFWNGDGTLLFEIPAKGRKPGRVVISYDCKKDYCWEDLDIEWLGFGSGVC